MKKTNTIQNTLLILLLLVTAGVFAQSQKINSLKVGDGTQNADAIVDMQATDKGLLIPRIALTATNAAAPLSAPIAGMVVYNTATAGTAPNNVTPGYYVNDGSQWVKIADLRAVGTNHITNDAGVGSNGTSVGTGTYNIALAEGTLAANTSGNYNIALGRDALAANTTGEDNVAIGVNAAKSITTTSDNVAIGTGSFQNSLSNSNVAIGNFALSKGSVAGNGLNVAIGQEALQNSTLGDNNVAIGYRAFKGATAGFSAQKSVAIGAFALTNVSGAAHFNTAIGYKAGEDITTGRDNTIMGYNAALVMTTGVKNTIIGNEAGSALTIGSDDNTLLGYQAGWTITTGDRNIMIGRAANPTAATDSYKLNIGDAIKGTIGPNPSDVSIGIGTVSATTEKLEVNGAIVVGTTATAAPPAGTIRWNGTKFQGWTGSAWVDFH